MNGLRSAWRDDWRKLRPMLWALMGLWYQRSSRRHKAILLLLLVVGVVMRLQFLHQPIRTDEALTYLQYASGNLLQPLYDYSAPNNHILHTIGVSITTRLLGNSEWVIRLTTFINGALLILTTYVMSALLIRRQPALIGAGLVAIGGAMIEYSTNARGYMLQANCLMLMIIFILLWQRQANRFLWLGAIISASLGFYTVPTMLYGFGAVMLWWLADIIRAKSWYDGRWWLGMGMATVVMTLILYMPVFVVSGLGAITSNQYVSSQSAEEVIAMWSQMIGAVWAQWHMDIAPPVQVVFVIGFVWGIRLERRAILPLGVTILLVVAVLVVIQRVAPFTRVFLIFFPIYAGILGAGLHDLVERVIGRRGHVVAISVLMAFVGWQGVTITQTQSPYWSLETGTMRDAEAIIRDLAPLMAEDVSIIHQHPSEKSFEYYAVRYGMDKERVLKQYLYIPTLFVVVNHEYGHSIESVFRHNALDIEAYTQVERWRSYPLADVYRYVLRDD